MKVPHNIPMMQFFIRLEFPEMLCQNLTRHHGLRETGIPE